MSRIAEALDRFQAALDRWHRKPSQLHYDATRNLPFVPGATPELTSFTRRGNPNGWRSTALQEVLVEGDDFAAWEYWDRVGARV